MPTKKRNPYSLAHAVLGGAAAGAGLSIGSKAMDALSNQLRQESPVPPKQNPGMHPVAETILRQLGGNKFIAMTGAKNFRGDSGSIQFYLPSQVAANGINAVGIILEPDDTYTMKFFKIGPGVSFTTVATKTDVYEDQLQDTFSATTGLSTHLNPRRRQAPHPPLGKWQRYSDYMPREAAPNALWHAKDEGWAEAEIRYSTSRGKAAVWVRGDAAVKERHNPISEGELVRVPALDTTGIVKERIEEGGLLGSSTKFRVEVQMPQGGVKSVIIPSRGVRRLNPDQKGTKLPSWAATGKQKRPKNPGDTDWHFDWGVVRWDSNNQVPPKDIIWRMQRQGIITKDTADLSDKTREKELAVFLAEYRKMKRGRDRSAEEKAELLNAYGPGVDIVDVITGDHYRTNPEQERPSNPASLQKACPGCGGRITVPHTVSEMRCPHCDARLGVQRTGRR